MKNRIKDRFFTAENRVMNMDISLKAKGLYAYLCSKPTDWDFTYKGICSQCKEGEKAIKSAVRELVENKLLIRLPVIKISNTGAKHLGYDWVLHPTKKDLSKKSDPVQKGTPQKGTPQNGTPQNGTPLVKNIESKNIESKNIKEKEISKENVPLMVKRNREHLRQNIEQQEKKPYFDSFADFLAVLDLISIEYPTQTEKFFKTPKNNLVLKKFFEMYAHDKKWDDLAALKNHLVRFCMQQERHGHKGDGMTEKPVYTQPKNYKPYTTKNKKRVSTNGDLNDILNTII